MLKLLKKLFKRKKRSKRVPQANTDENFSLKKVPISNQVKEIIEQASDNIKGPY